MTEIEAIISAYQEANRNQLECVLATVVHVEGSSYRRAGARMLIDENGMMTGAISGGCLEGDALQKALHALHQGKNKLITYDTSDENDAIIGAQLGCNGVIQVLFEPIDADDAYNPIQLLLQTTISETSSVLVSIFSLESKNEQPGTQLLFTNNCLHKHVTVHKAASKLLEEEISVVASEKQSQFVTLKDNDNCTEAFLQYIPKPIHLVVVGAGNDALILADMAEKMGWQISVTDGRTTHANHQRFAASCQVIVTKPEDTLSNIKVSRRTAFVLVSHNYNYDYGVLKILLNEHKTPYIGILGPRKKFDRMIDDLKNEEILLDEEQLSRIYAPIGLQLAAETPAEIALSIIAEIQAVFTRSSKAHLRNIDGTIHKKSMNHFKVIELKEQDK